MTIARIFMGIQRDIQSTINDHVGKLKEITNVNSLAILNKYPNPRRHSRDVTVRSVFDLSRIVAITFSNILSLVTFKGTNGYN